MLLNRVVVNTLLRSSVVSLALGLFFGLGLQIADAAEVHWRGGSVMIAPQSSVERAATLESLLVARDGDPAAPHMLVQFGEPITAAERAEVKNAGLRLLSYLGSHTYFATFDSPQPDVSALADGAGLSAVREIQTAWKLDPRLLAGEFPEWTTAGLGMTDDGQPLVAVYIMFHQDVDLGTIGVDVAATYQAKIRDRLESVNSLVAEVPAGVIVALAEEDVVQWIEPALPRLSDCNNSNRSRTQAAVVQGAPYNLDGSGVNVMVYDGGTVRSSHNDFGGRVSVRDGSGMSDHATHVAGTIGGSGASSGGTYKGMAPAVTMESYGFEWNGSGVFLYNNPGDLEDDYSEAINTYGVHIANNSIGTNTTLYWDCDITGDYGITSALIDNIVRGSVSGGAPFRVIWANGNERQDPRCGDEYYTTAPPAGAKNHITVGALNSNNDSMTWFSSWGPVDDGRLKPDISAPGCQSNDDNGVTSCSSSGNNDYAVKCGTSMACPTVTGLCALLLEDYRDQFPSLDDPRNSTLKILLAHNAVDRGNPGPDYQFGYGSVRIQDTIDFMRLGHFTEEQVSQNGTITLEVQVNSGEGPLKVTLAWDDAAGTPNVNPALVNDLDLRVFDPAMNQYYPWTLDPANPSANAVQTQADHVNNIEQVLVDNPTAGTWTIQVYGYDVPDGPQPFSLCASPRLGGAAPTDCNNNGIPDEDDLANCDGSPWCSDCNNNGIIDECDISFGTSTDCNSNGIPDECEPGGTDDCNNNGIADFCDILNGTSTDCNANDVPDECEITPAEVTIAFDLSSDPGWSTEGDWAYGQPTGNGGDHGGPDPTSGHTGPNVYGYNLNGDYANNLPERHLTSTAIDCSDLTDVRLSFWRWLGVEQPAYDHAYIRISTNGSNWVTIWENTAEVADTSWTYQEFDVSAYADGEPTVYLRWTMGETDYTWRYCGWNIDDIEIRGNSLTGGSGDCNGNGIFDACDILDGTSEDCNGNGVPDECDIADGTSQDTNGNGIPDECESFEDCNNNGTPDDQDIADGTSVDCNGNGVPDECDLAGGTSQDCNDNAVPDECELSAGAGLVGTYYDNIDFTGLRRGRVDATVDFQWGSGPGWPGFGSDTYSTRWSGYVVTPAAAGTYTFYTTTDDGVRLWVNGQLIIDRWVDQGPTEWSGTIALSANQAYAVTMEYYENGGGAVAELRWQPPGMSKVVIPAGNLRPGRDCNSNGVLDACDIDGGTSADCNGNGVPDDCDITGGTSEDCNGDGVPDECQLADNDCNGDGIPDDCQLDGNDCNNNGVPDDCDIAAGTSEDCNGDGVPDECQLAGNDCNGDGIPDDCQLVGNDCNNDDIPDDCQLTGNDCNNNGVPDDCDIADGTSQDCNGDGTPDECQLAGNDCNNDGIPDDCQLTGNDCNGNGVPDDCDIASGVSEDCNGDGVPDECQLAGNDCNANGVLDECDIANGTSQDCNANAVPDECDIAEGTSEDINGNGIPDECEADCNGNGVPDDVDIANGTSQDCNGNLIPDECDIAEGTSQDINGNGIPDECEADCNGNGVPDDIDIANGTSQDCNGNGVPDECDIAEGVSFDCNMNDVPDECDIAEGTSADCNANAVPDECDIAEGTSDDLNGNGIPDECEADCNGNGVPDDVDIANGTSQDCNGNGVPDECDIAEGVSFDCNMNDVPDECDIAEGTSADCNANAVPDECDIAEGTSDDLNGNGIPDECEADCNGNGVPDDIDIANGTSQDCNGNGVPDECDIAEGVSFDCNMNDVPDECDIAEGTSADCNANAVPDECDIAEGTSDDLNGNGIPDECEADCNGNGVPDDVDIANGTSQDCNGNGVPDECDIAEGTSADCNMNGIPDECDIAEGTSADCNANSVPDECDIAEGTSEDVNGNGVPDECEADCNGNGVPDDVDIANGTSQDCNVNGVPDECDIAEGTSFDCNLNEVPDECDIAEGTSADCNGNLIPDECDIAEGTSEDLNGNGVPDECEADCNGNGVPDDVDIANGTSQDCNGNGVPDECDIAEGTSQDLNGNGVPDECEADCNGNGVPDDIDIANGTSADCNVNGVPDECDIAEGVSFDCNMNGIPDECDVAEGTSQDCNGNLVPDECDIAEGASQDLNGNGIPDECEADCNGNGVPDDLDIANGTSQDCNGNSVPDECDIAEGTSEDLNGNGIPDECEGLTGDMNCDGVVDFDDISPFVLALGGQSGYEAAYPECNWYHADCDNDGDVDFDDINPFIALLGG